MVVLTSNYIYIYILITDKHNGMSTFKISMTFLQCQAFLISLEIPLFYTANENLDVVEETKNFGPGIQLLSAWIRH